MSGAASGDDVHGQPESVTRGRPTDELSVSGRAQSSVFGYVLIIGMVITSATAVVVIGGVMLSDVRDSAGMLRAENGFSQLDTKIARVALGDAPSATMEYGQTATDATVTTDERGWMRVAIKNDSGRTVLTNTSLGRIVYDRSGETVAYQGGGVWHGYDNSSTMVSPPEFHYRDTGLTLPLISVRGDADAASGRVSVTATEDDTSAVGGYTNPIEDGDVNVTVRSAYYQAWGRYFTERTEGEIRYDHANRTATLTLVSPAPQPTVQGAVVSTAGSSDEMDLDNNFLVNSYNSSEGDNPDSGSGQGNGPIFATGKIKLNSGNVRVRGNIIAGDTVTFDDTSARIYGDVRCARGNHGCVTDNTPSGHDVFRDGGQMENTSEDVDTPDPVGDFVNDKIRTIQARNDNGNTSAISAETLDWSSDTITLDDGRYYLQSVEMDDSNRELVLDTSDGNIDLAVDGNFHLDGSEIRVEGDGTVRMYADVSDEVGGGGDMVLDNGAMVTVRDGGGSRSFNATRLWLYAPPGIDADIDSGSEFTGVIYAPDSRSTNGQVALVGSSVYGAVVAHVDDADEGNGPSEIHFDEALLDSQVWLGAQPTRPRVTHMHITVNEIAIEISE